MATNPDTFIDWLNKELINKGWTDYQLAKQAGISHSVISKARQGTLPKWEACEAIARALGLPPETVYRKAGLLPSINADEEEFEIWKAKIMALKPEERARFLRQIDAEVEYQREQELKEREEKERRHKRPADLPG